MTYSLHRVNSDIWSNEHIIQSVGVVASKNILVDLLRDVFRNDREYQYVDDVFGFPKTPSNLGLDPAAGIEDEETTRIMIGSTYRYDVKFYPALTIKNTATRYVPVSFNQDYMGVMYRKEILMDGYGNNTTISTPAYHTLVGAWDQTFEVKVTAESEIDREEITDIVQTVLMGSRRLELQDAGLFIKTLSTSGESEEPYANGYLYSTSISLETRSEWKIHIPISNVVERIGFLLQLGNIATGEFADALESNTVITQSGLL
jgi:hypothetical protein